MEEFWKNKNFSFIRHELCEYFPCHETDKPDEFNCLFCYCPLYCLGERCGGAFTYTEDGIKDCSGCMIPHHQNSYGYIIGRYAEVAEIAKRNRNRKSDRNDTVMEGVIDE